MFLELRGIKKLYNPENGVQDINIGVKEGEFLTLLGPSGCGKTTLLNIIGGFLAADSGTIHLDNRDITAMPPEQRPVSTVFQSYALFPHMTVEDNVAYGLRFVHKLKRRDARERASLYLKMIGLYEYGQSRVGNLSGGQQQRVALARAMATNPKIMLLDEPLCNLDAGLRLKMRDELKSLQEKTGITMIFVTHDQEEALCLSDRIAVMENGRVVQLDSPRAIYENPVNRYVASFVGKSNYIAREKAEHLIRPEEIRMKVKGNGAYKIITKRYMGARTEYTVSRGADTLEINLQGKQDSHYTVGQRVDIEVDHYAEL